MNKNSGTDWIFSQPIRTSVRKEG